MYTVLIVDDEPLVQVGLQSMIDWGGLGIRLLPCASNGQTALETIRAHHPDLVFTDIRMPLMDGLELIRRCRTEAIPCPEFIVLTSYEDFGYAREAVKHHVADYLIKLELTPDSLTEVVTQARERASPRTSGVAAPGAEAPQDQALVHLLDGGFASDERASSALGSPAWAHRPLAVLACRLAHGDPETLPHVSQMVRDILGREYDVLSLPPADRRFVLVLALPADLEPCTAEARVAVSVSSILEMVHRYFNGTVEAGLGSVAAGLLSLTESRRQALSALDACTPQAPVRTWREGQTGPRETLTGAAFRHGLEQALAVQDPAALEDLFRRAQASIGRDGRLADALDLGTAALYASLTTLSGAEEFLSSLFAGSPEGHKSLYSVPSTDHVRRWLQTLETGLKSRLADQGAGHQEKLVESIRRYVETHCRERLQLQAVAAQFRLSPNYAGTLFRRFTGQGFTDYVCEVKVAKARELLDSRKYRVYEVSDQLGFENSYYFSKVFRRVTGLSPRAYLARTAPAENRD